MYDDEDGFDEVEHWLNFIRKWQDENLEPVPEIVLDLLEKALEKNVNAYRVKRGLVDLEDSSDGTVH